MKLTDLHEKLDNETSKTAAKKDAKDGKSAFAKLQAAARELDVAKKELKKNPFESVITEAGKLPKLVDTFLDKNQLYHFEGDRGVGNLEKLLKEIGYKGHSFKYGTPVEAFLSDNPGAIEALIEWIKETNVKEWEDALTSEDDEDEDEDDEEADDEDEDKDK